MKFIRGIFTSEFWTCFGAGVTPWFVDTLPTSVKAGMASVATLAYAVSRGLAKLGITKKD